MSLKAVTYHLRGIFGNPPINHVFDPQAFPRGRKDPHPNHLVVAEIDLACLGSMALFP